LRQKNNGISRLKQIDIFAGFDDKNYLSSSNYFSLVRHSYIVQNNNFLIAKSYIAASYLPYAAYD
jgi:hypothetical protein